MDIILKNKYSVQDRSTGIRSFLIIKDGMLFITTNDLQFKCLSDVKSKLKDEIIDCEYISENNNIMVKAFDIILMKENYDERYLYLCKIVQ